MHASWLHVNGSAAQYFGCNMALSAQANLLQFTLTLPLSFLNVYKFVNTSSCSVTFGWKFSILHTRTLPLTILHVQYVQCIVHVCILQGEHISHQTLQALQFHTFKPYFNWAFWEQVFTGGVNLTPLQTSASGPIAVKFCMDVKTHVKSIATQKIWPKTIYLLFYYNLCKLDAFYHIFINISNK